MEDSIIPCLPIRELHIFSVWAAVIRRLISETGNGKCLRCCDSSSMSHADSEWGNREITSVLGDDETGQRGSRPKKQFETLLCKFCGHILQEYSKEVSS